MKRNIILGVLLLSAVYVGSMFSGRVSAQKEVVETVSDVVSSPDSMAVQTLPFTQNWTNVGLITANDDWSTVPGVEGYLGQDITVATGIDPQTLLTTSALPSDLDVVANSSTPDTLTSGGVTEFDGIANPVVALQGSQTADAPFVIFYLNTTGQTNVTVAYNLRDIDGSVDNAIQPVALQYRVGSTGNFINVPGGFVADASSGPSLATLVTPVSAVLGADANNQPLVQVRVITANAVGSDEWIGIDDINVTAASGPTPTPTPAATPKFLFATRLNSAAEVPTNASPGRGYGRVVLNAAQTQITASFYWENLTTGITAGHIHGPAAVGVNAPVLFNMAPTTGATSGNTVDRVFTVTPAQVADLRAGLMYFNIHTTNFPGGEIRGQIISNLSDAPSDFNGDGRTDFGVVRQTQGGTRLRWYVLTNATPAVETQADFGIGSDSLTTGDFDGDGKDDISVYRAGNNSSFFFILQSSTNTFRAVRFGEQNDDPFQIADFDGDGIDDPSIYRRAETTSGQSLFWWFGSNGVTRNVQVVVAWGVGSDEAVPGDFNGDGKADFCVVRAISNRLLFYIHPGTGGFDATSSLDTITRFGLPTDLVVPGDYDGDGATDIAVSRTEGASLVWYNIPSSGGSTRPRTFWGRGATDAQVQGDYDGDGKYDVAVWRSLPTGASTYFIVRSSDNTAQYQEWGLFGDAATAFDGHNN